VADYINNVATADQYTDATTIGGPDFQADTLTVTVANAGVLMQLAVGVPGNWRWIDEREFLVPPQSFTIERVIGARFRSAVTATPAQILAALTGQADPAFGAGLPFTGTISASGGVSSNVILPTVALASFPPATPLDGQTVLLVLPSTYDPIAGRSLRWLCEYDASLAMWHVHGGEALLAQTDTLETLTGNGGYQTPVNACQLTVPRAGDYEVESGGLLIGANTSFQYGISYAVGAVAPLDNDSLGGLGVANGGSWQGSTIREKSCNALDVIAQRTKGAGAGVYEIYKRWIKVTPRRLT